MNDIVFFLEERSAGGFLQSLLPRMFPRECDKFKYKIYEGKGDLKENLVKDLKHYNVPGARFIILIDQDASDCRKLKNTLSGLCAPVGKKVTIRIVCKELESWYLAQLGAVEKAFGLSGLSAQQNSRKFRDPDLLATPDLILRQLTRQKYQKIAGSRVLGRFIDPACERSTSFKHFILSVKQSMS